MYTLARMHADSRQGLLPLADAMLEWSDPALVEAIRAEEARFEPGELEQLGHYTLADVRLLRRSPRLPVSMGPSWGPTADLERAWKRLFGAFRLLIECGEIRLRGVPTVSFGEPAAEDLPQGRAAALLFDPAAGAVFLGIATYVGVTATRGKAGEQVSVGHAPADGPALPLRDAIAAWCEPRLVRHVREIEARVRDEEIRAIGRVRLGPGPDVPPPASAPTYMQSVATKPALSAAWEALLNDLRQKIERGELRLRAVQTWPLRQAERDDVPGLWASEFWFDLDANRINVVQFNHTARTFSAVLVSRPVAEPISRISSAPPGYRAGQAHALEGDRAAAASALHASDKSPVQQQRRRRGGRGRYEPIIEDALREHWDSLFPKGPPVVLPQWTDLARRLTRRMQSPSAGRKGIKVPQLDTIRTRLPKIYPRVLSEKASSQANAQ